MDEQNKKISMPELIIVLMFLGLVWLLGITADISAPLPGVGQILLAVSAVVDVISLLVTQLWLILKGGIGFSKQIMVFGGNFIQTIPFLNMIPANIIAVVAAYIMLNNPKLEEATKLVKPGIK